MRYRSRHLHSTKDRKKKGSYCRRNLNKTYIGLSRNSLQTRNPRKNYRQKACGMGIVHDTETARAGRALPTQYPFQCTAFMQGVPIADPRSTTKAHTDSMLGVQLGV